MQVQEAPEIWETEEDKKLSIGKLKYRYLQYAKENFQGKVFINKSTGKQIRVSNDGIMEWRQKARTREHIISIKLLNVFLETAIFKDTLPDYKGRPEIESDSRYTCECMVNGKRSQAVITTRKPVTGIDKLRYYALKTGEAKPK